MADSKTCKHKRKPNWTHAQLLLLAQLVNENKDTVGVCPLKKKKKGYNFYGRFILTDRDRISNKKSRKKQHTNVKKDLHFSKYLIPTNQQEFGSHRLVMCT